MLSLDLKVLLVLLKWVAVSAAGLRSPLGMLEMDMSYLVPPGVGLVALSLDIYGDFLRYDQSLKECWNIYPIRP